MKPVALGMGREVLMRSWERLGSDVYEMAHERQGCKIDIGGSMALLMSFSFAQGQWGAIERFK